MPLESVRFGVLGAVRVRRGAADLDLGGPQERAFLALLLVRAGQPVAVSEIVDVLWGAEPPRSAVNVVRRHVGSLRRLLEPRLPVRAEGRWLLREAGGYRLAADEDSSDLLRFHALREAGRRAADESPGRAVELLTEALSLWRGPVAAGIPAQARAHPAFAATDRERLAAVRELADAALRAGRPDTVLPELRRAAAEHPLDEPVQAGLVLALAAAGRRPEALAAYETVRARLAEELGIDPGVELRDALAAAGLEAEPAPPLPVDPDLSAPPLLPPLPVLPPAQLPHDIATFTGRQPELDEVLTLFGEDVPPPGISNPGISNPGIPHPGISHPGTVVISAIGGMAGVGKTTLAVHWAHRVADRFPDGQLYVNLRGFDPSGAVLEPGEAVRGFLDALGVPPDRVPHGVDAQAALYRSTLAGRRVLVVLDNARDAEQVRPLLPGTPGCLAIVTSRDELPGLVAAHGAHSLTLRPFDAGQARTFLVRRLGAERVAAEPAAADEIGELCAGLPLALACVAARAALHPHFPLAAVAAELREAHGSLDAFTRSDASVDVGTVFSWSTRAVSEAAARLFRLLGLHPGPDFSLPAAAALVGLPVRRTRPLLAELTGLHLVAEYSPARYAFHDLLRAHAAELVHEQHTETERQAALDRLHHHYLHTAHTADRLLAPNADPLPPPPAPEGVHPEPLGDDDRALAWLTAEHAVLLAVVDTAAASGRPEQERLACQLAWSLEPFFDRRGHWHDGLTVQRTALDAARRLADPVLEARGLRGLARVEGRLGLHSRSVPRLQQALERFAELGDDTGRAHTHRSLGWESEQLGDLPGALRHNQLALALFRTLDDRAAQASVLNSVGWYHALLGEHRQALTHCFEALTMLQQLGDRYGQAATWDSIAYAHHHLGRHPHALLGYRNALALLRDLGVPYVEADILVRVGDTHLAMGDGPAARTAWTQALTLLRALDHPDAERVEALLSGREGRVDAG
ncbi:NB-ARC domain-containing protein [Streptomyces sp. NBC_01275]|uniref:AfsR/SARP family transcriptional regulator n=1 Tax=Streptomyces sp. NBC_01275 TaxID=2903807 RepID=UPI002259C953|nr:BTAD domain-containing putative transcriptional regulator [Streptomyces sp. NBC_01275]MCX4760247.1 NB-ARC domain-containing protein [Streptomyces sp. NBC_01275]